MFGARFVMIAFKPVADLREGFKKKFVVDVNSSVLAAEAGPGLLLGTQHALQGILKHLLQLEDPLGGVFLLDGVSLFLVEKLPERVGGYNV